MNYQDFKKYINSIDTIDETTYDNLLKIESEKRLNFYFNQYLDEIKKADLSNEIGKLEYFISKQIDDLSTNVISNDIVSIYFNEISKIPLLTSKEEFEITSKIKKLNLIKYKHNIYDDNINAMLNKYGFEGMGIIDRKMQLKVLKNIKSARRVALYLAIQIKYLELREKLISSNLKLVVKIAKRYVTPELDIADLIQEGNKGLLIAVDKFDPYKGYKFSTYAYFWIRQQVSQFYHNRNIIKLPYRILKKCQKLTEFEQDFVSKNGRMPNYNEKLDYIYNENKKNNVDIKKCKAKLEMIENARLSANPISIYREIQSDGNLILLDTIESKDDEKMIAFELRNVFKFVLKGIRKRDGIILLMRNGVVINNYYDYCDVQKIFFNSSKEELNDIYNKGRCYTLEEIASLLNLSRERIRQIECECKIKIKRYSSYFDDYSF